LPAADARAEDSRPTEEWRTAKNLSSVEDYAGMAKSKKVKKKAAKKSTK
jgi:hypothetical protein